MLTSPRIVLQPVEFVPVRSARFAFRCLFCLALTAFDAAVVAYALSALPHADTGQPLLLGGVVLLFAALFLSLLWVWTCVLRPSFH